MPRSHVELSGAEGEHGGLRARVGSDMRKGPVAVPGPSSSEAAGIGLYVTFLVFRRMKSIRMYCPKVMELVK
jgi:hypothetical protein